MLRPFLFSLGLLVPDMQIEELCLKKTRGLDEDTIPGQPQIALCIACIFFLLDISLLLFQVIKESF